MTSEQLDELALVLGTTGVDEPLLSHLGGSRVWFSGHDDSYVLLETRDPALPGAVLARLLTLPAGAALAGLAEIPAPAGCAALAEEPLARVPDPAECRAVAAALTGRQHRSAAGRGGREPDLRPGAGGVR
ncbi:hypothetical protein ACIGQE_31800 [Streptomyces sp. NPDC053429]|uniref:hypothetical protein n=1 Tax=Streptomyces sp. NPDC053429 TaxID=3365702 RepID=UPI0037D2D215